jgi:hypothetical protein
MGQSTGHGEQTRRIEKEKSAQSEQHNGEYTHRVDWKGRLTECTTKKMNAAPPAVATFGKVLTGLSRTSTRANPTARSATRNVADTRNLRIPMATIAAPSPPPNAEYARPTAAT